MKKTITSISAVILAFVLIFSFSACTEQVDKSGVWESATYLKDAEFGKGAKTVQLEVIAEEQSVTFTIHTDKETLGDALLEHGLIAGEQGAYGLYVKTVNDITYDYDKDGKYWAFYENGVYATAGVDQTAITAGASYGFKAE